MIRQLLMFWATLCAAAAAESNSAYLFAYFTGESPLGEQIYFAVSEDGMHWMDLNNSEPVLVSNVGEKGVRDPSLLRTKEGKIILLATDLRIANGKGWQAATSTGSTSIVIWESEDLRQWSAPRLVDIAGGIPDAGCAWAPEAILDEESGEYFVTWATISPRDGERKARIFGARTTDFRTFSGHELHIARPGQDVIDTQIIRVEGAKHKYYRVSCDGQITFEAGDSLHGTWERCGNLSYLGFTGKQVEGPILFKYNGQQKWGLLMDQYSSSRGYLPFVTSNLDDSRGFAVVPAADYNLGASRKRHGGILGITRDELSALKAKWPSTKSARIASAGNPARLLRHYSFQLRMDTEVNPAEDALWRLVPGLSGQSGTVSLRSVNYPDRFVTATADGVAMDPNDNSPAFRARATFTQSPGLADARGTSFRLQDSPSLYLRADDNGFGVGAVSTPADQQRATFLIR